MLHTWRRRRAQTLADSASGHKQDLVKLSDDLESKLDALSEQLQLVHSAQHVCPAAPLLRSPSLAPTLEP
eukprot:1812536-Rhodomonas_salina.1